MGTGGVEGEKRPPVSGGKYQSVQYNNQQAEGLFKVTIVEDLGVAEKVQQWADEGYGNYGYTPYPLTSP